LRKLQTKLVDMPPKPDVPVGTPSSGGYGLGRSTVSPPFSPEPFVFHGGSNNLNLAYIGFVAMTNVSGPEANEALMVMVETLYVRAIALTNCHSNDRCRSLKPRRTTKAEEETQAKPSLHTSRGRVERGTLVVGARTAPGAAF
jgi:hypothetical protein